MLSRKFLRLIFVFCFLSHGCILQSMGSNDLIDEIKNLHIENVDDDGYYSDSEDGAGYTYKELFPLTIPKEKNNKECVVLARGIHFSPSKFNQGDISQMRRADEASKDIFSSAAYDLAQKSLGSQDDQKSIKKQALQVRKLIKSLPKKDRDKFQEIYSNQYDIFHRNLGADAHEGIFKKFRSKNNPQVSVAENFLHAGKYASGMKYLGKGVKSLDPKYDAEGKPKHPYLGKLFIILVSIDQIKDLAPYFVVHGHANDDIRISYHFSNNILEEREVAFPGLIPGDCIVFSMPIRVPSFKGDYKDFYEKKFGLSKRAYDARKKIITGKSKNQKDLKKETVESLLKKKILPHIESQLKNHIEVECKKRNIKIVYKQLDGSFGEVLPSLMNANNCKKRISNQKRNN